MKSWATGRHAERESTQGKERSRAETNGRAEPQREGQSRRNHSRDARGECVSSAGGAARLVMKRGDQQARLLRSWPNTPPLPAGSSESANTRGQTPWGKTLSLRQNRFGRPREAGPEEPSMEQPAADRRPQRERGVGPVSLLEKKLRRCIKGS